MISICREDHSILRVFPVQGSRRIEFHRRFGFVSEDSLRARQRLRGKAGGQEVNSDHEFSFRLEGRDKDFEVHEASGCQVHRSGQAWRIESERGIFHLQLLDGKASADSHFRDLPFSYRPHLLVFAALALLLALVILWPAPSTQVKSATSEEIKPVIIQTTKPAPQPQAPVAPVDDGAKARQAIRQQLGFLKLAGRKDFRKAVGGLPTPTAQATVGAGPGGSEGSGGELLAGMGKGLHKTTVGNTQVAGLGGVGTRGAGGGLGGYGDTAFAASGGQTLSAIPLDREAKIDEGLDRSQIQSTIQRYLSQVRACYEEGLKRNQALIGQVTMGFEVGAQGHLNSAQVQRTSLNDRPVEECIRGKMMNWKFPQPRGGVNVKVSYPFMLRPLRT